MSNIDLGHLNKWLYQEPRIDVEMKDGALERQIMKAPKSGCDRKTACFPYYWLLVLQLFNLCVLNFIKGGVADNSNDHIRDSILEIKKIRDSIVCYMSSLLFQEKNDACFSYILF